MTTKPTNPKDSLSIRRAPLSTVPANVIAELGVAMLEGAVKYGRHNYRDAGVRASVYYDATMRHLMAWWEGENIDRESGLSHITKAIASLVVLRDAMMQEKVEDDRPPESVEFYARLNRLAGQIIDRHSDDETQATKIDDEDEPQLLEIDGKVYKTVRRGGDCEGCAFEHESVGFCYSIVERHARAQGVSVCDDGYIYQQIKP